MAGLVHIQIRTNLNKILDKDDPNKMGKKPTHESAVKEIEKERLK